MLTREKSADDVRGRRHSHGLPFVVLRHFSVLIENIVFRYIGAPRAFIESASGFVRTLRGAEDVSGPCC